MAYQMYDRVQIKQEAKERLRENRNPAIVVFLLVLVFTVLVNAFTLRYNTTHPMNDQTTVRTSYSINIVSLFLSPMFVVSAAGFFLGLYRGQKLTVNDWFNTLFSDYLRRLIGMLWQTLWVFLWSLLLVIPGLIKAIAYSMQPYILAECPNVDPRYALKLSMRMTDGYKMDIFVMGLSFLGWNLLGALTFGILTVVFAGPYERLSMAGLYDELKKNALDRGVITQAELDGEAMVP